MALGFGTLPDGVSPGTTATVSITDDDTAGVTVSETALSIDEGGSASYTVVLDTQPTGDVTVTVNDPSNTDITASPAVLTLTPSDWDDEQTVTVTAGQDADPVDDTATITHTVASDNDSKYDGISAGDVAVTVDDDETQDRELTLTMPVPVHGDTDGDGGINLGDTLTYTATATNSGNVTLEDVNVQDLLTDTSGNDCASLAVGGTCVLTGTYSVTQTNVDAGKVTNTVTATATGAATKTVTRETGVDQVQGLTLEKTTTDSGFDEAGDELDYSYKVTNSSTVTLTGTLEIDDDRMASADITCPTVPATGLALRAFLTCTGSYTVTQADVDEGEVENTATATLGGATSPQDTVTVSWRAPQGSVPALSIGNGSVQEDGDSISLPVALSPSSLQTVTVNYATANDSAAAGADYTASSGTLIFAPGDTGKTVTVVITDDDIDEGNETFKVNLTNPSNANITPGSETGAVTIQDDDTAGVTVSETGLDIDEGEEHTYTVVLDSQPTHSVTVTINDPSNTDVTADTASLTFTTDNWNDEQTVTVSAGEDAGADDETATVTHTATSADAKYSGISVADVDVSVTDDDDPDLVLSRSSASIQETAEEDFTVKLATKPSAQVTVAVSSGDTGAVSVSTASLTFTTTEWDTAQTVTVAALDDNDTSDETVTVTATASSSDQDYQGKSAALTVSVTDDDTRGLVISESSLDIDEGDATGEAYTVKLATEPTGNVTVAISGHTGTDLSLDETSLTFTTADWDTARTVTVTAGRDDDSTNDGVTLTHTASGGGYNSITRTLAVTIRDDTPDSVTANFEQAAYTVQEGSSVTVKVKLSEDPKRSFTIPITKSNQDGASNSDYSGVPANVTFNSGDTEKSITFSATMDSVDDDGESVRITFGTMPTGVSKGATRETVVSITDDDVPSVTVSFEHSTYTVAESDDPSTTEVKENEVAIKVTLSAEPERSVTISITRTGQGGATSADYSGMPNSVAFASAETEKSITFTAAGDDIDDDGESVKLTLGPTLPTGVLAGSTNEATVSITDDDTAGVTVSETSLTIGEGSTGTYTVVLTSQPAGEVTVTIAGLSETDITLSGETLTNDALTFTADNWSTAQTVTVTAGEDDDAVDEGEVRVTHTVSGEDYGSVSASDVTVTVTDDDSVGVTVTPTDLHITEGNSAPYSVVLNTEPSAEVTVALSLSATGTDVSVLPKSLTFTASTWDQEQTIEVSTVEDEDTEKDPSVTISHAVTGGDYEGVDASQVTVNLLENLQGVNPGDTPEFWLIKNPPPAGVSVDPTSLTIPEGESGSYTVGLDAQPSSTVTITVDVPDGISVSPGSLEFTVDDYAAQTVTVTAVEDDNATSEVVGITHDITGGGYNVDDTAGVTVNITDNDTAGVTVAPTELTIGEGETGQYTVVLDTEPTASVTVTVAGASGDVSVDSTTLTFTSENWDTARTVTVTAAADDDTDTDPAVTLTHTVTGGDYEGEDAAGVTVSITENDQVEPPAVAVSFEKYFHEVSEGAHSVGVGILLDNAAEREVTIPIDVLSKSTASAEDYSGVPGNVTFAPGVTFKTIWIVPTLEAVEEDDEEIWLGFGSLPDWVSAGAYDQTYVTIFDAAHLSFGSSSYVATEGRGDAIVAVRLNKPLPHAVSIPLTAEAGSGATSDDWSGVPQEVTFASGETEKTFTVIAVDDTVEDDGEMVTLGFGTLSDRLIAVSPATTVVTLVNMENGLEGDPIVPSPPSCPGNPATVGSIHTGNIETVGETDWWSVDLAPHESYTIHTRGADTGEGTLPGAETLQLVRSGSSFLTAREHSTAVSLSDYQLAEFEVWLTKPGTYCFEVGTREADGQGVYSLEVESHGYNHEYDVPADTTTEKTFATPVTHHTSYGFLGDHGGSEPDEDWFRAPLEGGVAYRILLNADAFEEERHQLTSPKLVGIHHPNGEAIDGASSTGTGKSVSVDFTPPRSGNYYIAVGSNSGDSTGMFVLCARVIAHGDVNECGGRSRSHSGYAPPRAPRNLKVSQGGSQELDVSWKRVSSSSGPGQTTATYGYKVQWKKASDSWEDQEEVTVSHRVPGASYTITGLENGTEYTVRVRAFNFMGVGDASAEASASPEQGQGTDLQDYNSPATGGPGIRGTPRVGNTLNATTQDIADEDGMTGAVFTYQWVRHDFGTRTDTDIDGATGVSYTVASGDAGQGIKVQVSFTDDAGNKETLTSYAVPASLPPLTADFPQSPYQSLSHQGADDRPQLIVTFSRAVPSIAKTTPSVLVTGGTVSSVRAHEEDGLEHAWVFFLDPTGTEDIQISLLSGRSCEEGGICAEDGAMLSAAPAPRTIPGPEEEEDGTEPRKKRHEGEPDKQEPTGSPPAPQNLTAVVNQNGSVTLVWDAPDDDSVTGYRVLRWRPTMDEDTLLVHVEDTGSTATTYTDSEVTGGVRHVYRVKAINATGLSERSNHVKVDPPEREANAPATGAPAITGTTRVGETLTADTSGIADENGLDDVSFTYQWIAGGADIAAATGATYTLADTDEGKAIRVRVSFTDNAGNEETLTSAATDTVAAAAQPNNPATGAPAISGTAQRHAQVGETLTTDTSGIADEDGLDNAAFAYQWTDGGSDIEDATGTSYTLTGRDEGLTIQVRVSFTDDAGNPEALTSAPTDAVQPPPNSPTITGTARVGQTLTADTSDIRDEDGMENAVFGYQWIAGGADIEGATGASYTIIADDEGLIIQVWVSFTDDAGNYETRISDGTEAVAPETPPNTPATGAPTITGTVRVGETLTADTSAIADADGMENAAFTYQWIAGGADIEGATGAGYTIIAEDEGLIIQVWVSFTDDAGNYETRISDGTEAVAPETPPNTPATGAPTITGTVRVGETLTADTSAIADADGMENAAFTYQWVAGGADIEGATGAGYTIIAEDEDLIIQVWVSFADNAGNDETLTSAATDAVAAAPQPNSPATGAPTVSGTAQVGQTLTANTSGVADPDGLSNVQYEYQWLADDSEIAGATGYTYTLVAADEGKAIRVRVSFTDNAGNEESLTSAATAAVAGAQPTEPPAKPTGLSATASNNSVTLTWNDPGDDSITGYVILRRVRVNDQGGDFSVLVADTGTAATTYTDDTVAASTTYTYRIKAINEHGTSERSRWYHISTPAAP